MPCEGACAKVLDFIRKERAASSWSKYYDEIVAALVERGVGTNGSATLVEIGTAYGGLAAHLMKSLPYLTVISVDPFLPYDKADAMSNIIDVVERHFGETVVGGSELWARAMAFDQNSAFGCRYRLIKGLSASVAADSRHFPMGCSIEAAFIDGDHTRRGVELDLAAFSPIVKPNGLLFFNDYGHGSFPGVKEVVDAHAARTRQSVITIGDVTHLNVLLSNLSP